MKMRRFHRFSCVASVTRCIVLVALVTLAVAQRTPGIPAGRIAFVGNQSGSFQLYTMNPDGSDMLQITSLAPTPFETWTPDFSSDGRRIVFCYGAVDTSGNLPIEIYVINVDGTGLTQLTHDGQFDLFPRWSPDGTKIVFGRGVALTQQLVTATMAADGSDIKELTTPLWGVARSGYTSDARHILWETQQAGFVSVIWSMDTQGSQQKQLTPADLRAGEITAPAADGKHIAFINNQNTPPALPNTIFVMNLDGSGVREITQAVGTSHDVSPNYSPDGTHIVFASDRMSADGSLDIFTMNADGSNITRIATGVTVGGCADLNCVTPAWGRKPFSDESPSIAPQASAFTSTATTIALTITSGAPPAGTVGVSYGGFHTVILDRPYPALFSFTGWELTAAGGAGSYHWSWSAVPGSTLPPGLAVKVDEAVSGGSTRCCETAFIPVIGGTPAVPGIYHVIVAVTDSSSPPKHSSATYTITILR